MLLQFTWAIYGVFHTATKDAQGAQQVVMAAVAWMCTSVQGWGQGRGWWCECH